MIHQRAIKYSSPTDHPTDRNTPHSHIYKQEKIIFMFRVVVFSPTRALLLFISRFVLADEK